jgi:hypothetical protein
MHALVLITRRGDLAVLQLDDETASVWIFSVRHGRALPSRTSSLTLKEVSTLVLELHPGAQTSSCWYLSLVGSFRMYLINSGTQIIIGDDKLILMTATFEVIWEDSLYTTEFGDG